MANSFILIDFVIKTVVIFHHGPNHHGLTERDVNRNFSGISVTR